MAKNTTKDMTQGPLLPLIVNFTIPLVLGSILQLTYNAVDSIIVGKYVGSVALAAVGTSNPIMTLLLMFFQGISLGTGVLVGNYFGSHQEDLLRKQVSTAMIAGCVVSVVMSTFVLSCAGLILGILQVDPVMLPTAGLYLRCIACGLIFNYIYNFFSSTLRAMGDSKSTLYFLGISSVTNMIGDLLLVVVFHMGVLGCALSTVASEALSCYLCYAYIKKRIPVLNLGRDWFFFDWSMLKKTLDYGLVSGFQQCSVQIGIVGVQGIVNSLGVASTAAFAAANRLDDYALLAGRNVANAMTSVLAQNNGAGKKDRVWKTFLIGSGLGTGLGIVAALFLYFLSPSLMKLFTSDPEVLDAGVIYLKLIAAMYVLPAFTNALQGYMRGTGRVRVTMIYTMINMGVRFLTCYVLVYHYGFRIDAVPWACFAGWVVMTVLELPLLRTGNN